MELIEVTRRHRNDFHWRGRCRHCGYETTYGDGYADHYYCTVVVPNRHCPECRKDCYGVEDGSNTAEEKPAIDAILSKEE